MIYRYDKYWFVRDFWGFNEIYVIFIDIDYIRIVIIEKWVERIVEIWKRGEICG